jgi:hypothetical protein
MTSVRLDMQLQQLVEKKASEQAVDVLEKNPARVAAGRVNVLRRRTWNEKQREAARQRALKQQPWRHSTGPRTPIGKQRSASNQLAAAQRRLLIRVLRGEATPNETALAALLLLRAQLDPL